MKLFGKFQIKTKNKITGKETNTGWIDNLVLNNAFNQVAFPVGNYSWYVHLGSGSTPPTVSDLSLESLIVTGSMGPPSATKAGASTDFVSPIYSTSAGWEYAFSIGAVIGNISEIGVGNNATTNLITRALITDSNGDPTTITVGVNDILTIIYRIGYEIDVSHPAGVSTVNFNGVDVDITAKWALLGNGSTNTNNMNGGVLPYFMSSSYSSNALVLSTLPADPLTDFSDAVTLLDAGNLGYWSNRVTATGSSWIFTFNFTASLGEGTGVWLGCAAGSANDKPAIVFEFSSPVTKAANQQFDMTLSYEIQRGI